MSRIIKVIRSSLQVSEMQIERYNMERLQACDAREGSAEEVQKLREEVHAQAEGEVGGEGRKGKV